MSMNVQITEVFNTQDGKFSCELPSSCMQVPYQYYKDQRKLRLCYFLYLFTSWDM